MECSQNSRQQDSRPRSAGVLLHVSSLPGPFGIGDLGPEARRWIDTLCEAGQTWWQMLPLGPPGNGDSPYQCFSAFAGNSNLISPELLRADGLVTMNESRDARFPTHRVDFERVRDLKTRLLTRAWQQFNAHRRHRLKEPFQEFCRDESGWLDDYALFTAIRESRDQPWMQWRRELRMRKPSALSAARDELSDEIGRHQFAQFLFFRQLAELRRHAKMRGVRLIGDLPIFVSGDSADVWAHPELFLLDKDRRPTVVAGVPPDYFSETGQHWGNPLYDWRKMQRQNFAWWVQRVGMALRQADMVRLDHFRGFSACWTIPAKAPTAQTGKWVRAPGSELFDTLRQQIGQLPFIAEDLGLITPDVEQLRDALDLPGMRVLQFAFGGGPDSPFLPHNFIHNAVVYTGTHDNDTTAGWYNSLNAAERAALRAYAPGPSRRIARRLIALAWSSVARMAIAPLQDVLELGSGARMNTPGTSAGNWRWRADASMVQPGSLDQLASLTAQYNRCPCH